MTSPKREASLKEKLSVLVGARCSGLTVSCDEQICVSGRA